MDEFEIKEIDRKQENPRLKRIPLDLGNKFCRFGEEEEVQFSNILQQYEVLLLFFGSGWVTIQQYSAISSHYEEINLEKKNLEIIYVSFDKAKKQYEEMIVDTPWLSIPCNDSRVPNLKQFYNIRAIPSLILVDNEGEILSTECREDIYSMQQDQAFEKWRQIKLTRSEQIHE